MKIRIIAVGKLKEKYLVEGCKEYIKRLTPFAQIQIVEIGETRVGNNPSDKEIDDAIKNEGEKISAQLDKGGYNICCCIEGQKISSPDFSALIERGAVSGGAAINFVIGSSFGLHDDVKKRCDSRISMSDMTFPHQLFRLMLLEQIYRGYKILSGSKYHK